MNFRFSAILFFTILLITGKGYPQNIDNEIWANYLASENRVIPNITYLTANNTELKLDLYLPGNTIEPATTVLFFHGGGWVVGQKERSVLHLLPYIALGFAVVNVEYRLAGNSLAPAAVIDCRYALRWVISNAKRYNFNTDKIILTGASAGGHLALITGMLPNGSAIDNFCPTPDSIRWTKGGEPEIKAAAIINWYGITNVADLLEGENAKHYAIEWIGGIKDRNDLAKEVSPVNYFRSDLPAILTIHGDEDSIVPYSHAVKLHTALNDIGTSNQLYTIKGGGHGGFNRKEVLKCYEVIKDFLYEHHLLK
jgi:acetyl esterase/lipase